MALSKLHRYGVCIRRTPLDINATINAQRWHDAPTSGAKPWCELAKPMLNLARKAASHTGTFNSNSKGACNAAENNADKWRHAETDGNHKETRKAKADQTESTQIEAKGQKGREGGPGRPSRGNETTRTDRQTQVESRTRPNAQQGRRRPTQRRRTKRRRRRPTYKQKPRATTRKRGSRRPTQEENTSGSGTRPPGHKEGDSRPSRGKRSEEGKGPLASPSLEALFVQRLFQEPGFGVLGPDLLP